MAATGNGGPRAGREVFNMGMFPATTRPEILMARDCPFCKRTHRSPYVDELEEAVMACRERVRPDDRGSLETWEDPGSWPVSEIEAFAGP